MKNFLFVSIENLFVCLIKTRFCRWWWLINYRNRSILQFYLWSYAQQLRSILKIFIQYFVNFRLNSLENILFEFLCLASNEIVLINFYTNWCRFSQILSPIYDQFADKVQQESSVWILIFQISFKRYFSLGKPSHCHWQSQLWWKSYEISLVIQWKSFFLFSVASIRSKYHVKKYPTIKLFRNGLISKREYRGSRWAKNFIKRFFQ